LSERDRRLKFVLQKAGSGDLTAKIKEVQRKIIQRRLALIKDIAERGHRPRRYFRDVVDSAKVYGFFDRNALLSGLEAFRQIVTVVGNKGRVSALDIAQLNTDLRM
jgi:hypothetical protein